MKKPKQVSSSFLFQKQLLHDYQTSKTSFSCEHNDEKEELHIQHSGCLKPLDGRKHHVHK